MARDDAGGAEGGDGRHRACVTLGRAARNNTGIADKEPLDVVRLKMRIYDRGFWICSDLT